MAWCALSQQNDISNLNNVLLYALLVEDKAGMTLADRMMKRLVNNDSLRPPYLEKVKRDQ